MQLNLLFMELRVQRFELGFRRVQSRLGLIQLLFADDSGSVQAAGPFILFARVDEVGFLGSARILLAAHRGLLLGRINLHQARSCLDGCAGLYINLCDPAIDLGHDHGRIA